jgi:hypothetical protein
MKLRELRKIIRGSIDEIRQNNDKTTTIIEGKLKSKLIVLIKESLDELKSESENGIISDMEKLQKIVDKYNKNILVKKSKEGVPGSYEICDCFPHYIEIRPKYMGMYDVEYIRDNSDREKKLNLKFDDLKDYVEKKLTDKSGNYVEKSHSKSVENSNDVTNKDDSLPSTTVNAIKKVTETKNENKDFVVNDVKNESDFPDKPMSEVNTDNLKKLSSYPTSGDKVKYVYPTQTRSEKKHVVKGGTGKELKLPLKNIKRK